MFKLTHLLTIILVLNFLGLKNIWAESANDVDLSKIVVTPSRIEEEQGSTPAKVDIITHKEIQSSASSDLTGPLTGLTGVNISDYGELGSSKSVRMRGSTSAQVLVLVDGRPVNSPRDGEIDLSTIALDNIEKVEVVHGPGSSLYGSSAMGGTINILTKNPPKKGQKTEVFSSFGTFRTYNERLSHGARIGDFGYLLNTGYQYSNGYRENSKFDSRDLNTKLEYALNNENSLNFNTGVFKSKKETPGSISYPDSDNKQNNIKNFQDLNWDFKPDESLAFSAKTYSNHDRFEYIDPTSGNDTHTTDSRGLNTQVSKKFTDIFQGTYGFNYVENLINSSATGKHDYLVRAGYMENHFEILESLKLNLGTRIDDYSNFGTQTCPSFGAVYNFKENNALRFSWAKSFRAPTLNDLYWPYRDYGFWYKEDGNPNLKPEKGRTVEVVVDTWLHKNLSTSVTYFRNDFTDLIVWTPDETNLWSPKNLNKTRMDGVEWENKLFLFQNFEIGLNYTFLKATDRNTRKDLTYQPRNKVDTAFKYHNITGFTCELTGQFTSRRFHDPDNTDSVKKFYVYGLNLSQKINKNMTGFLWFKNALNRKYVVIKDYPAPGFSATTGIKASF